MSYYAGPTEALSAGDVAVGDQLVDNVAESGYLTVTEVVRHSNVYLKFDNGEDVVYAPREVLRRVQRSAEAAR